jgi:hypothetical protein
MFVGPKYGPCVMSLLAPRVLKWRLDIWNICVPFANSNELQVIFYKILPLLARNFFFGPARALCVKV